MPNNNDSPHNVSHLPEVPESEQTSLPKATLEFLIERAQSEYRQCVNIGFENEDPEFMSEFADHLDTAEEALEKETPPTN